MRDHRAVERGIVGLVLVLTCWAGLPAARALADPLYSVTDMGAFYGVPDDSKYPLTSLKYNTTSFDLVSHPPTGVVSDQVGWNQVVATQNDSGVQVGTWAPNNTAPSQLYLYDPNTPAPPGQGSAPGNGLFAPVTSLPATATGINDKGQVIGSVNIGGHDVPFVSAPYNPTNPSHPFAGITLIPDLGTGLLGSANAINNAGAVVGQSSINDTGLNSTQIEHAFLYQDGKLFDINNLIPSNSGVVLYDGIQINAAGQILAYGYPEGQAIYDHHLYELTPQSQVVPEPGTLALFGLAAAALAVRKGKRGRSK